MTITIVPIYYYFEIEADINLTTFKYAAYIILFSLIPQMMFHFWYWFLSKNIQISFNTKENTIAYTSKSVDLKFSLSDIESVETNLSFPRSRYADSFATWDNYCYSVIHLNSGEELLVTSLIIPDLIWPIELPNEEIEGYFICWPPKLI